MLISSAPAQSNTGTVKGTLADDSGAVIPAASVSLVGGGVTKKAQTQADGSYTFVGVAPGNYTVNVNFPGFGPVSKPVTVTAGGTVAVPLALSISTEKQEVEVKAEMGPSLSVEPDNNATALTIKGDDLAALPDDPDDLSDALQALAGPGAGPNGGAIYIDGFSGGQLPPKESIREIRINQNPFSAEYDRLGFGRIEILTKPGSDKFRGSVGLNDGNGVFNSRNPFASNKPDYSNRQISANLSGPINKRSSFFMDFNRRDITDNAITNAVYVDPATSAQHPEHHDVGGHAEHVHNIGAALRLSAQHQQYPDRAHGRALDVARKYGLGPLQSSGALLRPGLQHTGRRPERDGDGNFHSQSQGCE